MTVLGSRRVPAKVALVPCCHPQFSGDPQMIQTLDRRTLPAFERMNQALKQRAEQAHDTAAHG